MFPTRLDEWKVSQSVKEVLQGLVDDGLVQSDKIGSSNCAYFNFKPQIHLTDLQSFGVFHLTKGQLSVATSRLGQLDNFVKLRGRVNAVKETLKNNQSQLEGVKAAIAAEQALRPESVSVIITSIDKLMMM